MKIQSMKAAVLGTGLLALTPFGAEAAPSAFVSKCGAITINNQTGATLMRDTEDCTLIWVLPPTAGTTQMTGHRADGNVGFCKDMVEARGNARDVTARIKRVSEEIDELGPDFEKANKKVEAAKLKVRELKQRAEVKQLADMQTELEALESRIEAVNASIEKCDTNCDEYELEYRALGKRRVQLNADIRNLRKQNLASLREYDRAKAELDSAEFAASNVASEVKKVMDLQASFRSEILNYYRFFALTHGGEAHIDFDTGWDQAVSDLNQEYGGSYQFRKVPTKEARIFANLVGANDRDAYLGSMPALLDYSIDGHKYQPWGDDKEMEKTALPSRLGGTVRLSLVGICPLFYKNFADAESAADLVKADKIEGDFRYSISSTYKYPAAFHLKMKASYNLFKFYEKIVESSSSGGFFSSHTATSVAENKIDRDSFNIDWKVEDPDSIYDETKRHEISTQIKLELIGRVLGSMAEPIFGTAPSMSVPAPVAGPHGAIVFADGINSVCGAANVWCASASWLLKGLDAVFGSNSATSTYRATHDRTAEDTWSSTTVKWNTGTTSFTAKKEI